LAVLLAAAALWTFAYGVELASAELTTKLFWAKVQYFGIVTIPTAWALFAWEYTGHRLRLSKPLLGLLIFIPAMSLLAAWTNEWHGLFWSELTLEFTGLFLTLKSVYGPIFWLHWAYSNVLILSGMLAILMAAVRHGGLYRRQGAILLLAALLPWMGNLIYLSGSNPFPGLDLTSVGFAFTSMLVAWVVLRYRLLDVVPVARQQIITGIQDGLLVLDEHDRILDVNPAMAAMVGADVVDALIGAQANEALPSEILLALQYAEDNAWYAFSLPMQGGVRRYYEVKIVPLLGGAGVTQGRIIHVRDISEHRAHLERLRVLRNIDQAILAARSSEEIANTALRYLRTLIPSRRANVLLFDPEKRNALFLAEHADSPGPFPIGEVISLPEPWRKLIFRSQQRPLVLDATSLQGPGTEIVTQWLRKEGFHSIAAFPLLARNDVIGSLNLLMGEEHAAPDEETLSVAEEIATSLAVALDHARLAEQLQDKAETLEKRLTELEALYEISLEINRQRNLSNLLSKLVERVRSLLDVRVAALYLMQPDNETLELALIHGEASPQRYSGTKMRLGEGLAGRIADRRDVMMIEDYQQWEGRLTTYDDMGLHQTMGAPLMVGEQLLGVLTVGNDKKAGPYSEHQVRMLRLLAEQAATAIAGVRLLEAEQEQRRLAEALKNISLALSHTQNIEAVFDILLSEVRRVVPYDGANIMLIDGDVARIVRTRGYERLGASERERLLKVKLSISSTRNLRHMRETREPLVIADVEKDPDWLSVPTNPIRSWVGAPIVIHDEVAAYLSLDKYDPDFYTQRHAQRLAAFCGQAAIAIENIWLYQSARRRADLSARLVELGDALNRPLSKPEVIEAIGSAALALSEADKLGLFTREGETFHCAWSHNLDPGYIEEVLQNLTKLPGKRFFKPQAPPLFISDVLEADVPTLLKSLCERYGHRSLALWPLVYEGRVIAVTASYYHQPHEFSPEEQQVMMAFARQAAVALENARLFEEAQKRLVQARTFQAVGALLTSELGLEQVLEHILDLLKQVVEYDGASIQLLDEERKPQLAAARGYEDMEYMPGLLEKRVSLAMRTFEECDEPRVFLVRDAANDPRCTHPGGKSLAGSCVSAPLIIKNRLIGILNVDNQKPLAYDDEICETIIAFANQAAIAIENARLYEDLQQALYAGERVFRVVSHELRTPITVIHGYAELLDEQLDKLPEERRKQALSIIMEQTEQLRRLVDQLMAYHELERQSLRRDVIDVAAWLHHASAVWEPVMLEKDITLRLDLATGLGYVMGDRDYLDRVLNNLLHNASKFTPDHGEVMLRAWPESDAIYISVKDQGVGIPPDRLDKLFEPFYQVESGAQRRFRGLGLGLSLAKEIIARHGGRIWAESEGEGKGATFIFTLPCASEMETREL